MPPSAPTAGTEPAGTPRGSRNLVHATPSAPGSNVAAPMVPLPSAMELTKQLPAWPTDEERQEAERVAGQLLSYVQCRERWLRTVVEAQEAEQRFHSACHAVQQDYVRCFASLPTPAW